MLPKVIKDAILSVEGQGYAGRIDNIEWPKVSRKTEEYRAGGMLGPVMLDLGQEAMELTFEASEQTSEMIAAYGVCGLAGVKFRINASAESEMDCSDHGIEAIMTGRMKEIDFGTSKPGELQKTKYTVSLATFKYAIDGRTLFDIDFPNNIYIVNGRDLLEKRRANLKQ